jgi:hypothetical protein
MPVGADQQDRLNVALAAVTSGRLTQAEQVVATRGQYCARADKYGVRVTETAPGSAARVTSEGNGEPVLELWGADMMEFSSPLKGAARRAEPMERARVAARTMRDHDLDSLQIAYSGGEEISADRAQLVLYGPRRGAFRRRDRILSAALGELL